MRRFLTLLLLVGARHDRSRAVMAQSSPVRVVSGVVAAARTFESRGFVVAAAMSAVPLLRPAALFPVEFMSWRRRLLLPRFRACRSWPSFGVMEQEQEQDTEELVRQRRESLSLLIQKHSPAHPQMCQEVEIYHIVFSILFFHKRVGEGQHLLMVDPLINHVTIIDDPLYF